MQKHSHMCTQFFTIPWNFSALSCFSHLLLARYMHVHTTAFFQCMKSLFVVSMQEVPLHHQTVECVFIWLRKITI